MIGWILFAWLGAGAWAAPQKLALLVGIAAYGDGAEALGKESPACKPPSVAPAERWGVLHGARNDVAQMQKRLSSRELGFDVTTLTDCAATREGIAQAVTALAARIKSKDDIVVFYFSGHGQQITDDDGDEADGYDESLVPYDNRGKRDGRANLRDDEFGELIGKLAAKSENTVVILDSCHSGSGLRGSEVVLRGSPTPAGPPLPEARRRPEPESRSAFLTDALAERVVFLSAARAEEPAIEKAFMEGATPREANMGALTFLMLQTLESASGHLTWRGLVDGVRMRMRSESLTQDPQLEGRADRYVFGGGFGSKVSSWRSFPSPRSPGEVVVEAGRIHGLHKGDVLALTQAGSAKSAGEITLEAVSIDRSVAAASRQIRGLPEATRKAGFFATLVRPASNLFVPRFDLKRATDPGARKRIEKVLGQLTDVQVLGARDAAQADDLVLETRGGRLRMVTGIPPKPVGFPLSCNEPLAETLKLDHPRFDELLTQAVNLYAMRVRIMQVSNEVGATRRDVALTVQHEDGQSDPFLRTNERFHLVIRNRDRVDQFATIVELRTDGGTQLLFPDAAVPGERDRTRVPAGGVLKVGPFLADPAVGTVAWKLITTDKFVDFGGVDEIVPCRAEAVAVNAPGTRGSSAESSDRGIGDPELAALVEGFQGALLTRSSRRVSVEAAWGSDYVQAQIVKE